jgi:hypothetical protein
MKFLALTIAAFATVTLTQFDWPLWALWGVLIAAGNCVYTKIKHNDEVETISLMMAMILLAIMNLSWPEIAAATLLGVTLGQMLRSKQWYKKAYSIVAISIAAVVTEIIYTFTPLNTVVALAVTMDLLMAVIYAPVWYRIAGESVKEIIQQYKQTFWTAPVSAVMAFTINEISSYQYGIAFIAVVLVVTLRPRYEVVMRSTV